MKFGKGYILIVLYLFSLFSSCVPRKELVYFQDSDTNIKIPRKEFILKYKISDELRIDVVSEDLEAVKPFNLAMVSYNASNGLVGGQPTQQTYFIDDFGNILFPVIGKVKLAGLTWKEATDLLNSKLRKYVADASVNIFLLNFRVNVMGDVRLPGTYTFRNGRVTILDAISSAGDLNVTAERLIEIKRETSEGMVTGKVDLTSNEVYKSPFFYLQQNDVIYVRPNKYKTNDASFNRNTGLLISMASIIISLIAVVIR